ncbi:MAG TPA: hemerythrin domain-containing protein [Kiloniellales bacterium]
MSAQTRPETNPTSPVMAFTWHRHAPEDFKQPLTVIETDHATQLAICDVLDRIIQNPRHGAAEQEIKAVHEYLCTQMPHHIADEEEDLFPLLRRSAAADGELEKILGQLHREHHLDQRLDADLRRDLNCLICGQPFADPVRFLMTAFAFGETQRRHLAWENAVVVSRARKYLTMANQAELGRRMAKRRGIALPD